MSDTATITPIEVGHAVFVSVNFIGSDDDNSAESRRITFHVPEGPDIEKFELVKLGWAWDGDEMMADIVPSTNSYTGASEYFGPFDTNESTLSEAMRGVQLALGQYFGERGIGIDFA